MVEPDTKWVAWARHEMNQPPYLLDEDRRKAVLTSIVARCSNRGWHLLAAHVRTNHVHVLIDAEPKPERVYERSEILRKSPFE